MLLREGRAACTQAVATFAANVPFGETMVLNTEVHRMATVLEMALIVTASCCHGPDRALPTNRSRCRRNTAARHDLAMSHWAGSGVLVIANFGEVTLLPYAAVDQRDVILGEFGHGVSSEIRNDRFRMLAPGSRTTLAMGVFCQRA